MDAKVDQSSKLQDLPFDCLYQIFRYLSLKDKLNFSKVCSEWIDLDRTIGQVLEFALKDFSPDLIHGNEDIQYMPRRTMNLQEFREIMMNWGSILKKFCITLTFAKDEWSHVVYVFDAIAYEIDGELDYETLMDIVIQNCHDLRKLEIRVRKDCVNLAEKFHALFLVNPKLTDLKLDVFNFGNLNEIIRLKDASGPVKNLSLDYNKHGTSTGMANNLCEFLNSCNVNLKELRLGQENSKDMSNLMSVIANYARELQVLQFDFRYESTDSEMFSSLEKLSVFENLEDLSIELRSTHIKDEVYSIISKCRKLKKIRLRGLGVTDKGLQTLMTALPNLDSVTLLCAGLHSVAQPNLQYNLRSLEIFLCSDLSEDALKKISLLTNLEELSITGNDDCTMTDIVITEITFGCQKLTKVTIIGCKKITGNGINTLVTAIPNLESLDLRYLAINSIVQSNAQFRMQSLKLDCCSDVKNDEFKKIAVFKNLRELYIDGTYSLTDEAFFEISSACKQLTKVTLRCLKSITNKAIHTLVSTLPKLEYLQLYALDITSILPEGFQPLNLRRLKVTHCQGLPEDTLERLITQMPEMETIIIWIPHLWRARNASYNSG